MAAGLRVPGCKPLSAAAFRNRPVARTIARAVNFKIKTGAVTVARVLAGQRKGKSEACSDQYIRNNFSLTQRVHFSFIIFRPFLYFHPFIYRNPHFATGIIIE
ncbi:hypothetical protein [Methylobacterium oryzae]|uniref:hypothetical protein n=1 Tax=Methylobacterium oryzae TaxID=334852 RepID=UPI002F3550F0